MVRPISSHRVTRATALLGGAVDALAMTLEGVPQAETLAANIARKLLVALPVHRHQVSLERVRQRERLFAFSALVLVQLLVHRFDVTLESLKETERLLTKLASMLSGRLVHADPVTLDVGGGGAPGAEDIQL